MASTRESIDDYGALRKKIETLRNSCLEKRRCKALLKFREEELLRRRESSAAALKTIELEISLREESLRQQRNIIDLQKDEVNRLRMHTQLTLVHRMEIENKVEAAQKKLKCTREKGERTRLETSVQVQRLSEKLDNAPWVIQRQKDAEAIKVVKNEAQEKKEKAERLQEEVEQKKQIVKTYKQFPFKKVCLVAAMLALKNRDLLSRLGSLLVTLSKEAKRARPLMESSQPTVSISSEENEQNSTLQRNSSANDSSVGVGSLIEDLNQEKHNGDSVAHVQPQKNGDKIDNNTEMAREAIVPSPKMKASKIPIKVTEEGKPGKLTRIRETDTEQKKNPSVLKNCSVTGVNVVEHQQKDKESPISLIAIDESFAATGPDDATEENTESDERPGRTVMDFCNSGSDSAEGDHNVDVGDSQLNASARNSTNPSQVEQSTEEAPMEIEESELQAAIEVESSDANESQRSIAQEASFEDAGGDGSQNEMFNFGEFAENAIPGLFQNLDGSHDTPPFNLSALNNNASVEFDPSALLNMSTNIQDGENNNGTDFFAMFGGNSPAGGDNGAGEAGDFSFNFGGAEGSSTGSGTDAQPFPFF